MSLPLAAQYNSPQVKGYVARASAMLAESNYQGCLDQCGMAMKLGTPEREKVMWMSAVASYRGGFADAATRLGAFMAAFPASPRLENARLMLASLTFFTGDYAAALPQLLAVSSSSLEPDAADELAYRTAYCYQMLGDYTKAADLFSRLDRSPRYADASRFYRGYAAWVQGDNALAESLLSQADTSVDPGRTAPYYLAEIAYSRGDYNRVLDLATPLLRLTDVPGSLRAEGRRLCGESLFALGREGEGLALLRQYVDEVGTEAAPASTLYVLGVDHYRQGRYDKAIETLSAIDFPNDAMGQNAALFLGLSYLADANNSAAILAFRKAIGMDFDRDATETAFYNYAVASMEGGRVPFGSSIATCEEFIRRFPRSRYAQSVQEYLVKGYMATDDYEAALRSINSLGSRQSDAVLDARQRVHFVLGTRSLSAGDAAGALTHFREADKLASRNQEIARQNTLWMADALYAMGDYSAAERNYRTYLSRAPKSDPNVATATYNLGYALFGSRHYPDARQRLLMAARSTELGDAIRADAYNRIADTYYYESTFDKALDNYRLARETSPSTGDYSMLQEAMMQGLLGRHDAKLKGLDLMADTYPQSPLAAEALTEKAQTLASTGRPAEAIAVYEQVAAAYPSAARGRNALLQLAILHFNTGNRDRALSYYRQVVSSYPSSAEASMAVQDMTRIYGEDDRIDELTAFLAGVKGAPQVDSVELSALASASLLKKTRTALSERRNADAMAYASELLDRYPDSEGAEEALLILADLLHQEGRADEALRRYTELEARASGAAMNHRARMGVLAAASDLGRHDLIISTARSIRSSAASSDADMPRVNYLLACALHDSGQRSEAMEIWTSLAARPSNLYGTRAAISMAEAQRDAGRTSEAIATVNSLIDANPPHAYWMARAFILLSDLLRAEGSDFEADEYLRALRLNYPGTDADIFQMIDQRLPK